MTNQRDTRADGGVLRDQDGGSHETNSLLGVDLPEDSLFTLEEYLEMYDVASSEPAFSILCALSEEERLSAGELSEALDRDGNELHYHLRKLKRTALIRNRRDPNTGTEDPYSYYALTDLGETVLTHGVKAGVEKLAAEEATISDKYEE
ncbi:helix-turn-helix domain-containing protein [Halostagnicola sp. A-GB9-2]|uniref:helix-turn-helix domain-containing protein n=1 Tax=Halostagnicola sp. A-GB9-2 TaxID=3048066 RepID=UPI0024C01FA9|nr:helix-turn-helix domain-containing protein [Halostagnicola sp. A-GB9-2]MDJ1434511.1 helix-turn-helix domain-containing protein [Halostagnicola sp. A-GB9-2]